MTGGPAAEWDWVRRARVIAVGLLFLAGFDCALVTVEHRKEQRIPLGEVRNAPGMGTADLARLVMLGNDQATRNSAIVFSCSSITYGLNLADKETIPAPVADAIRREELVLPAFNFAHHHSI